MVSPGYSPEAQWNPFCWPRSPATKRHGHFGSNMVKRNGLICPNMVKYRQTKLSYMAKPAPREYGKIEQRNELKFSQLSRSHLNITTQTRGDVCICYLHTVSPQIFGICSPYHPKYQRLVWLLRSPHTQEHQQLSRS